MIVLIATEKPFAAAAVNQMKEIIENSGAQLRLLEKYETKQQLLDAAKDANAIIVRSDIIDSEVIENAKELKVIVRAGAGYDNIDLKSATEHNVIVMNTPGQNANAVAELIFGLLIYKARNHYDGSAGTELKNKTFGLHAFGNVARNVARIAKGFGMKVYAFDPFLTAEQIESEGVTAVNNIQELYKVSKFVSLHIPATPQTIKSINYDLLSLMPKNATLINTARKEVIDEDGLLKLMNERSDFTYVSDVKPTKYEEFTTEFPERVFFTPKKMGAQTKEANINAGLAAAQQAIDYLFSEIDTYRLN